MGIMPGGDLLPATFSSQNLELQLSDECDGCHTACLVWVSGTMVATS